MTENPVRDYQIVLDSSGNTRYVNRLLVATPTTGVIRMEWATARWGQIIPTNWSLVQVTQWVNGYIPLGYQVADAQNLIVRQLITHDFEWLLLIEHDTMPPPDAFVRFNDWMRSEEVPIVSGLYFTKSVPSEPLVYRGRGISFYGDWKMGDLVWCDGVPTGCLLIHAAILRAMWEESEEYLVGKQLTRRVFDTPRHQWFDPEAREFYQFAGTSDLAWCNRVMKDGFFAKAGWHEYEGKEWPFLVDTNIFCRHIDIDGVQYPLDAEIAKWKLEQTEEQDRHEEKKIPDPEGS